MTRTRSRTSAASTYWPASQAALKPHFHSSWFTRSAESENIAAMCRRRRAWSNWIRVEHKPGALEPLLWVADIVAGVCRAHRQGLELEYRDVLGHLAIDIEVDSGC